MNPLLARLLDSGLALNDRAAAATANGIDWLFRREALVKSGLTPFETVLQGELMSVRHYGVDAEPEIPLADGGKLKVRRRRHPLPLVLVPPLGVTSETFDLLPNRSLVRFMAARGFHTYLIDWGRPQRRHAGLGIRDYADLMMAEALRSVRRHSGQQELSLMGWCMGGLLILLHAGLKRDRRIRNIVTIASPIDLSRGGVVGGVAQAINAPARLLRRFSDFKLHSIDPHLVQPPSWATTLAFKLTDPMRSLTTYWDLLMRLWDREFVESHSTTSDYLNNMLVYPFGMVQDFVVHAALDNKLGAGRVRVGQRRSEFRRIEADLLVFAGAEDALVRPATARRIMELTNSSDRQFETAPGGHMGVMLGAQAQAAVWARAADWLAPRSRAISAPR